MNKARSVKHVYELTIKVMHKICQNIFFKSLFLDKNPSKNLIIVKHIKKFWFNAILVDTKKILMIGKKDKFLLKDDHDHYYRM